MSKIIGNLILELQGEGEYICNLPKSSEVLDCILLESSCVIPYVFIEGTKEVEERKIKVVGGKYNTDISNFKYLNTLTILAKSSIVEPNPKVKLGILHVFIENTKPII